jgi:hypothetical protein
MSNSEEYNVPDYPNLVLKIDRDGDIELQRYVTRDGGRLHHPSLPALVEWRSGEAVRWGFFQDGRLHCEVDAAAYDFDSDSYTYAVDGEVLWDGEFGKLLLNDWRVSRGMDPLALTDKEILVLENLIREESVKEEVYAGSGAKEIDISLLIKSGFGRWASLAKTLLVAGTISLSGQALVSEAMASPPGHLITHDTQDREDGKKEEKPAWVKEAVEEDADEKPVLSKKIFRYEGRLSSVGYFDFKSKTQALNMGRSAAGTKARSNFLKGLGTKEAGGSAVGLEVSASFLEKAENDSGETLYRMWVLVQAPAK